MENVHVVPHWTFDQLSNLGTRLTAINKRAKYTTRTGSIYACGPVFYSCSRVGKQNLNILLIFREYLLVTHSCLTNVMTPIDNIQ